MAYAALWLQWWVEANERQPNQHLGLYLGIYGMIFALSMVGMLGGCW
jgi:ATP-binding cassette subfamily C (CFTR/MRP) protein 1